MNNIDYGAASNRNPFSYVKVEQVARDISSPWLTLDEIRQQINLYDDESQDGYLASLELAVRQAVEDHLGLSIFPITYRCYYDPAGLTASPIALDLPEVSQDNGGTPGVTVGAVRFYNSANVLITVDSSQYYYDATGNKVVLNFLPTDISTARTAPVIVEYSTAASPIASYPVVKQAGLLLFTHLYNNRSNSTEANLKKIPFGFETLLRPYKPLIM